MQKEDAAMAVEKKETAKAEETKTTPVKAEVKETAAKTKETTKKVGRPPKKATAAKAVKTELKPEIFIQYQGMEAVLEDAVEQAKSAYVADGHRVSSIKSLQIYVKPEEGAAYYVINQKFNGQVNLF